MKAVFVDVHGVLLDFLGGLEERTGHTIPPHRMDFHNLFGIHADTFWRSLNQYAFWREFNHCPYAGHILRMVKELTGPFYVLTRPMPYAPKALEGTISALCQSVLSVQFDQIVITTDKAVCAHNAFLIDDQEDNCKRWRKHGGVAFQWPCQFNDFLHYGNSPAGYTYALADLVAIIIKWTHNGQN